MKTSFAYLAVLFAIVSRQAISDDVRAEAERLRAEGIEVGTIVELAGQMRIVDVYDPDGNRIQLAQAL